MVYIREAHPTDEWQLPGNIEDRVEFAQTRSTGQRPVVTDDGVRTAPASPPAAP